MKTRNILFLLSLMLSFSTLIAQNEKSLIESIKKEKSLGKPFKEKAIRAIGYLDSITANKPNTITKFEILATAFEEAIEKGNGKEILTKKDAFTAKANHPGKNEKALKKRIQFYIKQMERVFDDE